MLLTYKMLKSIFNKVNMSVFDGKIPKLKLFIRTEYKDDGFDTCYAWFEVVDNKPSSIVFNQFDQAAFAAKEISKEEYQDEKYYNKKEIIGTMAHELIHAWRFYLEDPKWDAHDEVFREWAAFAAQTLNLREEDIIHPDTYD